ncbi:unnamed protein product [Periconia digitata]|uniref:Nephrocystin 3-like N-terminal domain-containing protein n=1 Tax=Periconia digitata TaxID=1303443 RepID=A0A9W4XLU7_9PLEO|nr:unnamed protein product [Periconia digitata]
MYTTLKRAGIMDANSNTGDKRSKKDRALEKVKGWTSSSKNKDRTEDLKQPSLGSASPVTVGSGVLTRQDNASPQTISPLHVASQPPTAKGSQTMLSREVDTDGILLRKLAMGKLKKKHQDQLQLLDRSAEITIVLNEAIMVTEMKRYEYTKTRSAIRSNDKIIKLGKKAESILVWLDKVRTVGDVAANADPIHIGLPWAGIRLLLIGFVAARQESTAFLVGVEAVSYISNRLKVYVDYFHSLGGNSDAELRLQASLAEMYSTLFKFIAKALIRYERSKTENAWKAFWSENNVQVFERECERNSEDVERDAAQCAREKGAHEHDSLKKQLKEFSEIRKSMERLEVKVDKIWENLEEDREAAILGWISPIHHEDLHYNAHHGITEGTGDWIIQHPTFLDWDRGIGPKIMYLAGNVGTGKTKLTAHSIQIFKDLLASDFYLRSHNSVAYFYFKKDDPQRGNPLNAFSSLLKQLAVSSGQIHKIVAEEYAKRRETGHLTLPEVHEFLCTAVQSYDNTYLIIDAFDECEEKEQYRLIQGLKDIVTACPQCKVFISSRPYEKIKSLLEGCAHLDINSSNNKDDIYMFITDELAKCQVKREKEGLPLISPETGLHIIDMLMTLSDGMFQWVRLHLDRLLELETDSDIREELKTLPAGLEKTYDQIWARMQAMPGKSFERAKRALQWALCARHPQREDRLLAAICRDKTVSPGTTNLQLKSIFRSCPGLLDTDDEQNVIFTHLSVREYFATFHKDLVDDGAMVTASFCLRLLLHESTWTMSENPTDFSENVDDVIDLVKYAREYWAYHCQIADDIGVNSSGCMKLVEEFRELQSQFLGPEMCSTPSQAYFVWAKNYCWPYPIEIIKEQPGTDSDSFVNLGQQLRPDSGFEWHNDTQRHYAVAIAALFLQLETPVALQYDNLKKKLRFRKNESTPKAYWNMLHLCLTDDLQNSASNHEETEGATPSHKNQYHQALASLGIVSTEILIGRSIDIERDQRIASITPELESEMAGIPQEEYVEAIRWCLQGFETRENNTWRRDLFLKVYLPFWYA